jgi:hypothetical protein
LQKVRGTKQIPALCWDSFSLDIITPFLQPRLQTFHQPQPLLRKKGLRTTPKSSPIVGKDLIDSGDWSPPSRFWYGSHSFRPAGEPSGSRDGSLIHFQIRIKGINRESPFEDTFVRNNKEKWFFLWFFAHLFVSLPSVTIIHGALG